MLKFLIQRKIINNQWINPVWRFFGIDAWLNNISQYYIDFNPNDSLSLQEIAGYSNKPEINATLEKIHAKLKSVLISEIDKKSETFKLLDIGCGPGLFLKDFEGKCALNGIDISSAMVKIARRELPKAKITQAHFLKHTFDEKFDAIYSIGVLIYFNHSQIKSFFQKISDLLNESGIVFISYPHAYRAIDLKYPDFTYVNYSSDYLEKIVSGKFDIIYHQHVDGSRLVIGYDTQAIPNPNGFEERTYQNSSILVLRKR